LPIRYHHNVDAAPPDIRKLCQVICASDRLSAVYHGSGSVRNFEMSREILRKMFDLTGEPVVKLIDEVARKSDEVLSQFNIESSNTPCYSEILQKANEELSRLNFSYETLIIEFRESQRRADMLASELRKVNAKLRDAAFRDDLTGLYNHRYFHEALTGELASAERYRHPLSLIMFDIDNFKTINDTQGHQIGDMVLMAIGNYLLRTCRAADISARYGGDEFVVLLRDTDLDGARTRAASICSGLGSAPLEVDGFTAHVTVSVGVAGYDKLLPVTKYQLIDLADKAMYQSKTEGRNRVSIQQKNQ
ncbi:MAG TPA: diguanylate cyclase, partial [Terriglobia bacterium]|nr:diguanylate cyclase [Terriglobia bacterium]